jgi:hypothetical protein
MLSWRLAERRGAREQYIGGLEDVVGLLLTSSLFVVSKIYRLISNKL